jgi:tRNA(Ile)-lysidine synthase
MTISRQNKAQEKFMSTIRRHRLWTDDDKLLLGISGGADSVALAHLALEVGINLTLAHVNYNLRGQESDQDQAFVVRLAQKLSCQLLIKSANTKEYAERHGLSTQVAAREIRYEWWENLTKEHQFTRILTAHHADDQLETIILFLLRGGSFGSFKGIPVRRGPYVRPLLFHTKTELTDYLRARSIPWREDSSNKEDAYLRNQIRHQIIPELTAINPNIVVPIAKGASEHQAVWDAALWASEQVKPTAFDLQESRFLLNFQILEEFHFKSFLLHTWLSPLGFNADQLERMMAIQTEKEEKPLIFKTERWYAVYSHGMLKGQRNEINQEAFKMDWVNATEPMSCPGGRLHAEEIEHIDDAESSPNVLILDGRKWQFPFTVRTWQDGDSMQPKNMKGTKKIKALLNDQKKHVLDRQKVLVLCQGETVLWTIGVRKSIHHNPEASPRNKIKITWIAD